MEEPEQTFLEPKFANSFEFLRKGYSFRELAIKAFSIKIYSWVTSRCRYSFFHRGSGVDIHHQAIIDGCRYISLGDRAFIQRGAWLTVPLFDLTNVEPRPYLVVGDHVRIGPNCLISAAVRVELGRYVLIGPNVTITDHSHRYARVDIPIASQGVESRGGIVIEDNCWLGAHSTVYSARGDLRIGRNSVIAAHSFVRDDVPPYTVVAGNPAVPVKRYDHDLKAWVTVKGAPDSATGP